MKRVWTLWVRHPKDREDGASFDFEERSDNHFEIESIAMDMQRHGYEVKIDEEVIDE